MRCTLSWDQDAGDKPYTLRGAQASTAGLPPRPTAVGVLPGSSSSSSLKETRWMTPVLVPATWLQVHRQCRPKSAQGARGSTATAVSSESLGSRTQCTQGSPAAAPATAPACSSEEECQGDLSFSKYGLPSSMQLLLLLKEGFDDTDGIVCGGPPSLLPEGGTPTASQASSCKKTLPTVSR